MLKTRDLNLRAWVCIAAGIHRLVKGGSIYSGQEAHEGRQAAQVPCKRLCTVYHYAAATTLARNAAPAMPDIVRSEKSSKQRTLHGSRSAAVSSPSPPQCTTHATRTTALGTAGRQLALHLTLKRFWRLCFRTPESAYKLNCFAILMQTATDLELSALRTNRVPLVRSCPQICKSFIAWKRHRLSRLDFIFFWHLRSARQLKKSGDRDRSCNIIEAYRTFIKLYA
eukprot:6181529-Pleurochrysis_carterae.AAC.1